MCSNCETRVPNKENLRLWVQALRSGKFTQGRHRLKSLIRGEESYCCLGVACELALAHGVQMTVHPTGIRSVWFDGNGGDLPEAVQKWLGVYDSDPVLMESADTGEIITAIQANDSFEWTFNQIADAIEARFKLAATEDNQEIPA